MERISQAGLDPAERRALLNEARDLARERVLSVLVDEMAETMLVQMRDELSPSRPPHVPPGKNTPRADPDRQKREDQDGLAWYVYGVIAADAAGPPASLPGIDPAHETTLVQEGRLAAVVSFVPLADFDEGPLRERLTDMRWLERTARSHEEVLELIGRQRTLIPMRICSIYRDQAGVQEMLRRESDTLRQGLEQLQGRTEWGMKVFADRAAIGPEASPADDPLVAGKSAQGTAYLRRRQEHHRQLERVDQELEEAAREIHADLEAIAAATLTLPVQRPEVTGHPGDMILNAAYLVGDNAYGEFVAGIDRLRERFQTLELVLTGPWPAYNFVPGAIGAGL